MKSADELKDAMDIVTTAISHSRDIEKDLQDVAGYLSIPHCAFMLHPGDERRTLLGSLVKPVSDWAKHYVFKTLEL